MAIIKIKNPAIDLDAAEIPNLPASKITSGTFANDKLTGSGAITINGSSVALGAATTIATGTDWQSVQTSNFTAVVGKGYPINTTGGAITCTFPGSASAGDTIVLMDYARNFATNALTINQNSLKFQGNTSPNPIYNTNGQTITCTYIDTTQGWIPSSDDDVTLETPQTYSADFLVTAGGGGGSGSYYAGGGGAGGYRNSYSTESSGGGGSSESSLTFNGGTVYTITVGAGGSGGTFQQLGSNGVDSSISGLDITTITSTGGGRSGNYSVNVDGASGGSGGGAGTNTAGTGGSGTANQGYAGGDASSGGSASAGGGGGGAGAVGSNNSGINGGAGGNGLASSITGSSVTRGGGGGGSSHNGTIGSGGTGGGGDGSRGTATTSLATSGTANTGGGGGGANYDATEALKTGGNGGSGVVILRMATAYYTGTTSGSPTVTTDGTDTILTFTGSGSYTG